MAKKDEKEASSKAVKLAEAPQGFTTNVGRERGDGWIVKDKGVVVQGRILGRYLMKARSSDGSARAYYQVKLQLPVKALFTPGEEDENYEVDADTDKVKRIEVELQPGQVVNVDEITALKDLSPYTRDGGVYNVWFQYIKQDPKLRNFWRIKGPSLQTVSAPKHAPTPESRNGVRNPGRGGSADMDDIPFE